MAVTTTIRVSTETRDLLKRLSRRHKTSAGETIAELVHAADDDMLLADAEAGFRRMAGDPRLLAAYRAETAGLAGSFDAPLPEW
jgi:predicted DNA-binding protein